MCLRCVWDVRAHYHKYWKWRLGPVPLLHIYWYTFTHHVTHLKHISNTSPFAVPVNLKHISNTSHTCPCASDTLLCPPALCSVRIIKYYRINMPLPVIQPHLSGMRLSTFGFAFTSINEFTSGCKLPGLWCDSGLIRCWAPVMAVQRCK